MILNKYTVIGFSVIASSLLSINAAIVQPQVNHTLDGSGDDVYFYTSTGVVFGANEAYLFYGIFGDITSITPTSTAQEIQNDFKELGIASGDSNDVYSASPSFSQPIEGTQFEGRRGYLVVANNANIGSATEIAIVSNSSAADWTFNTPVEPSAEKTYTIFSGDYLQSATGADLVLGSYGAPQAGFQTIQLNVVTVPEPSSLALLGLGVFAVVLRRKK